MLIRLPELDVIGIDEARCCTGCLTGLVHLKMSHTNFMQEALSRTTALTAASEC
jgi:hypothetical protein